MSQKMRLCLVLLEVVFAQQKYFKPRWHTPNEWDAYGVPCSEARPLPSRDVTCPTFCVRYDVLTSPDQLDMLCNQAGDGVPGTGSACPSPQQLMPDGTCAECVNAQFNGDDVTCDVGGAPVTTTYVNPCACVSAPGGGVYYRPCSSMSVNVESYYSGDDLQGELTMAECAIERNVQFSETEVDQDGTGGSMRTYPFPLLYQEEEDAPFGFLQCPNTPTEPYDYLAPIWLFTWCLYSIGIILLILYAIYKYFHERNFRDQETLSKDPSMVSLASQQTSSTVHGGQVTSMHSYTRQYGYRFDWFGAISRFFLIFMTVYFLIFMLIQILDVYGLWFVFCGEETRDACDAAKELGTGFYSWRSGFECGALCVFSFHWSRGQNHLWPYWTKPGGGMHYMIVWIVTWHIATVWLVSIKMVSPYINTYFHIRCDLEGAKKVLVSEPGKPPIVVEKDLHTWTSRILQRRDRISKKIFGAEMVTETCEVKTFDTGSRYFEFRCQRYVYDESLDRFGLSIIQPGETHKELSDLTKGLSSNDAVSIYEIAGPNAMDVPMPGRLESAFTEIFDYFYMYQFFCLCVFYHFYYFTAALAMTIMIIVSTSIKIAAQRRGQSRIHQATKTHEFVTALRDGAWVEIDSRNLVPGDRIKVTSGRVVADCALQTGKCVVDESSLTGEPNPIPKIPLRPSEKVYVMRGEDAKFTIFSGTKVEATTAGEDGLTTAVVYSTGSHTNKGMQLRDILFPVQLRFKFDEHWTLVFLMLMIYAFFVFLLTMYFLNWLIDGWFYGLSTVAQIVSPLVPAVFVQGQALVVRRLEKKEVYCVNLQRALVAGKIKIACFDKTGTLTDEGLFFDSLVEPKDGTFIHEQPAEATWLTKMGISVCHELDTIDREGVIQAVGNDVDMGMFAASGGTLGDDGGVPLVTVDGKQCRVLRRFEFSRDTMTMTCVISVEGDIYSYTKGPVETVVSLCSGAPERTNLEAVGLARNGKYCIGLAHKKINISEGEVQAWEREQFEEGLTFCSIVVFLNPLKEETAEVMSHLKQGAIRPVMITGDNAYTGVHVARTCGLTTADRVILGKIVDDNVRWFDVSNDEEVDSIVPLKDLLEDGSIDLAVTGGAFELLRRTPVYPSGMLSPTQLSEGGPSEPDLIPDTCMDDILRYTRVYTRMRPDQKAECIGLHMKQGITSMCGDGANDAPALQRSHAGFALASGGNEASDASLVSHYSTPHKNLDLFLDVVIEGRSALATVLHGFKYLIVYGQLLVVLSLLMPYFGFTASEPFWITVDCILNTAVVVTIMMSKPAKRLSPFRPTSKLLGMEITISLGFHILMDVLFTVIMVIVLFNQPWFRCKEFDANIVDPGSWWLKGDNYEAFLVGIITFIQVVNAAGVYNYGFDYRRSWLRNFWVPVVWALGLTLTFWLLLSDPNGCGCLFRMNCGDASLLERWGELDLIRYNRDPLTAPDGCACESQITFDDRCEAEYAFCDASQYNQVYHHNIFPSKFRYMVLVAMIVNGFINFVFEGFVMTGWVRRKLRERRSKRDALLKKRSEVIVGKEEITNK